MQPARGYHLSLTLHLSFADHTQCFDTLNRSPRRLKRSEALHRPHSPFDGAMVLLHNVVQISNRPASATPAKVPVCFNSAMTLGYDGFPSTLITLGRGWAGERKAFKKNRFAAAASRFADSRKSIVAPVESTARYK